MRTRRTNPWGLAGLIVLGLAVGCTENKPPREEAKSTSPAASPETLLIPPPALARFAVATPFDLVLAASSTLPGQTTPAALEVKGQLWLISSGTKEKYTVRAVLDGVATSINGKPQEEFQAMVARMNEGATFEFDSGVFVNMSVPATLESHVANLWRTIGSSLQHAGKGAQGKSWSVREHDSTGEYQATYQWDGNRLKRAKKEYMSVLQAGAQAASLEQLKPEVLSSGATIELKNNLLTQLELAEKISADLQKGVTMTVSTQLSLRRVAGLNVSNEVGSSLEALEKPEGHAAFSATRAISLGAGGIDQAAFDDQRLDGWTFEAALAEAARVSELAGDKQEEKTEQRKQVYSAYSALVAYLRSRPEVHTQARQVARGEDAKARVLISALGDAGTEAAQELLTEIIKNVDLDGEYRSRAIVRLARTQAPISETVSVLSAQLVSERLWGQAILALGIAGRNFRDARREQEFNQASEVIKGQLQMHLEGDERKLSKVLAAVSNLGDRRLLPLLRPLLASETESIRTSAAFALRHMRDDAVDPIIAKALAENGSNKSRLKLLSAIRIRGPRAVHRKALQELLAHDETKGQVRTRATHILDSWDSETP